jgi:allantoinase
MLRAASPTRQGAAMAATQLTIRSQRVVTAAGLRPAAVHVRNGAITAVTGIDDVPADGTVVDAGTDIVAPGLVDIHVHVNEPGRTEWEGFATATRAAAAGGVTTLVDMPLNSVPPTVSLDALERKRTAAEGQCHVDVGFWGGAVPGNLDELADLHAAGVFGFKAFLVDPGVVEFGYLTAEQLEEAMARLGALDALTVVHAEDAELIAAQAYVWNRGDPRAYRTFLLSRPEDAEHRAVDQVAGMARRTGARAHVLHLSSAMALEPLRHATDLGVALTAETCPHYLALDADAIPDGATAYKCAPPIRDADNRDLLWAALADGTLSVVASDHSPCPAELKHSDTGNFRSAWGGIASLQLGLAVTWTQARLRGHTPQHLARWMSTAPARLVGLRDKGALAPGHAADICVWDPDATWMVDGAALEHRHPVTPYDGMRLRGRVTATYLRGRLVYERGTIVGAPHGRLLARETT